MMKPIIFVWLITDAVVLANFHNGYSDVLNLLNYPWSQACPSDLSFDPHPTYRNAVGPCPSEYQIISMPPNYKPSHVLQAKCLGHCDKRICSSKGAYKCRDVWKEIRIMISDNPLEFKHFHISIGCLCTSTLARKAQHDPFIVD